MLLFDCHLSRWSNHSLTHSLTHSLNSFTHLQYFNSFLSRYFHLFSHNTPSLILRILSLYSINIIILFILFSRSHCRSFFLLLMLFFIIISYFFFFSHRLARSRLSPLCLRCFQPHQYCFIFQGRFERYFSHFKHLFSLSSSSSLIKLFLSLLHISPRNCCSMFIHLPLMFSFFLSLFHSPNPFSLECGVNCSFTPHKHRLNTLSVFYF